MKKRKKGITRYTVMFIPDTSDNAKTYELTFDRMARWIVLVVCIIALVICLFVSIILRNNEIMYGENGYVEQIRALQEENDRLRDQAGETAVSKGADEAAEETAALKEEGAGEAEKDAVDEEPPAILPINGIATVIKDPTGEAAEYPDRMVFLALKDSEVIAGADGIVKEIYEYEQRKNEYSIALLLDHRNGYETVYLISGEPKLSVQKGMRVGRGDVLARLSEDESIVGYDILYGGTSLNPAELTGKEQD
ncbi:MAG: peptidoglycan DD-metalloendopeptidase family protein [Lachnospiraceae bacterium]|nr:peptidoglycan DD-metalloendopeptidase family protein [Lachnospiraceae bacterium]